MHTYEFMAAFTCARDTRKEKETDRERERERRRKFTETIEASVEKYPEKRDVQQIKLA